MGALEPPEPTQSSRWWQVIILGMILGALGLWFFLSPSRAPAQHPEPHTAATELPSRTTAVGEVTVTVTPKNVAENAAAWEFSVVLDTHSVELSEDIVAAAVLIDDQNRAYRPLAWEGAAPGGHHRSGVLRFRPLVPRPAVLSLKLRSIGGVEERSFVWTLGL